MTTRRQRSTLSTYAPLLITVTLATAAAAAWLYHERQSPSSSEDEDDDNYPSEAGPSAAPPPGLTSRLSSWARSPSPAGALLDSARSAVAAAGTSLGLGEKGKRPLRRDEGFSDHERWSEERRVRGKVGVVVSAVEGGDVDVLNAILPAVDARATELFVLVFAPEGDVGDELSALAERARAHLLPFATPTGYVHMLRHLAPGLVYVQDTPGLSGRDGETVGALRGWVGQTVVVVDEQQKGWWSGNEMIGPGKGIEVIDTRRAADDWTRRLGPAL